jgi:lipopolysaccharide/colanic/teichoic acid biosynthesis glycosyltransferase
MAKQGAEYLNSSSKRRLDILGGLGVAAALTPAVLPVGALACIDNRSLDPFFRQERLGRNGEPVGITKFRSLRKERTAGELKLYGTHDPRATGIGLLLRRYGLDEMPQLLSVLNGDLSLVGIRVATKDIMDELVERAPNQFDEWQEAYNTARPGLISPAKFYTRQQPEVTDEVLQNALEIEIDYVKRASLINDLRIIGATPLKLIGARLKIGQTPELSPAAI